MENFGWKEGQGLGKSEEGIKEALHNEGQPPRDKRGIGYHGEKLAFGSKRQCRENPGNMSDVDDEEIPKVSIGTIYDNPSNLDKEEPTLRSNDNTFVTRYKEIKR